MPLQSFWMLVASLFFAITTALVKESSTFSGTFEIVFWRSVVGLIFAATVMKLEGVHIGTPYIWAHMRRSVIGTFSFTLWFFSLGGLPLATATSLNYTAPLFIALVVVVSALWHHKKAPWLFALASTVGFIGVCMILQPAVSPTAWPFILMGLTSGALGPIIFFQIQALGKLKEPAIRIVFYFSLVGVIWGALGCVIYDGGFRCPDFSLMQWICILGVGLAGVLAQICHTRAYAYGTMMLTACFQYATIPFSELLSVIYFHESLPMTALIGMILVVVSGASATMLTRIHRANKIKESSN